MNTCNILSYREYINERLRTILTPYGYYYAPFNERKIETQLSKNCVYLEIEEIGNSQRYKDLTNFTIPIRIILRLVVSQTGTDNDQFTINSKEIHKLISLLHGKRLGERTALLIYENSTTDTDFTNILVNLINFNTTVLECLSPITKYKLEPVEEVEITSEIIKK